MNENAKKWVKLLRSGKYRQTIGKLCDLHGVEPSYCCLGVACELYQQEVGRLSIEIEEGIRCYNGEIDELPSCVSNWLGLKNSAGIMGAKNLGAKNLIFINDNGATFDEIADLIESEPKGLFVSPIKS